MGLAAVLLGGCGEGDATLASKIGSPCTVQFRRGDALGAGSSIRGTLTRVTQDWILVTAEENAGVTEYHIPKEVILVVEFWKRVEPSPPPVKLPASRPQEAPASPK
jgi:hypothetical protein